MKDSGNLPPIAYTLGDNELPQIKKRHLQNGVPVLHPKGEAVLFLANGREVYILLATHPELRPQVEAYQQAQKAREDAAKARREAVIAACPPDHVPATQLWANGDLCAAKYQLSDGREVMGPDTLKPIGEGIYYLAADLIPPAKPAPEPSPEPSPERPIPDYAIAAYRRYNGSADRAWEAEDEEAWAIINEWGHLIEKS